MNKIFKTKVYSYIDCTECLYTKQFHFKSLKTECCRVKKSPKRFRTANLRMNRCYITNTAASWPKILQNNPKRTVTNIFLPSSTGGPMATNFWPRVVSKLHLTVSYFCKVSYTLKKFFEDNGE